jgi:hypothetical protein
MLKLFCTPLSLSFCVADLYPNNYSTYSSRATTLMVKEDRWVLIVVTNIPPKITAEAVIELRGFSPRFAAEAVSA